ncbi:ABC transporter permease subunit [Rhodococcus sp. X156]|uniref:ABC transporter permease n=1 Tax=Rhodococcus sp. X156 TaxID=2499145 RepID=UPI000FD759C7|nr:ABC transporter permease subunit [Rhodococcus sp. X156]
MTAPTQTAEVDESLSFVEVGQAGDTGLQAVERDARRADRVRLVVQPVAALLLAAGVLIWALVLTDLNDTQKATVNWTNIRDLTLEHLKITFAVALIVVVVAIVVGTLVTRPGLTWLSPLFIGIANIGASAPAIGLLVLFYLWVQEGGVWSFLEGDTFWVGVLPLALYALLPVLRNTILGYQEVDPILVDAGRGQGMSAWTVLRRVEFPLAVPYILAGLRTSLVLAVGTATLVFLVGAGGLGQLIDTGYKLNDMVALLVGALLAVALALLVDWVGALAEQVLGPKGLR